MRKILLSLLLVTGCMVGTEADGDGDGDGAGDDTTDPTPDGQDPQPRVCSLPESTADTGALAAFKAQQCNVSGSQGLRKWYRVSATMGGTMDFIQVELWDGLGAFTGGAVAVGSYPLTGAELDPARCGVCVRGLGDKGAATQKEYFATGGTVEVTAVGGNGQPVSVTLSNVTFAEIDAAKAPVASGCAATVTRAKLDGTIVAAGGGGGGGGGGGCPAAVGE